MPKNIAHLTSMLNRITVKLVRQYKKYRLLWHTRLGQRTEFARGLLSTVDIVTFLGAVGFIVCLVMFIGFDRPQQQAGNLLKAMSAIRWLFVGNVLLHFLFDSKKTLADTKIIKWIVDIGILVSGVATLFHGNLDSFLPDVAHILCGKWYMLGVTLAYAVVDISYGLMRAVNRRTNPPLLLSVSFLVFIVIGSLLLMLPKSTLEGISYVDALFVSTSAVCITGLTPVDVATTFTPFGQIVLALLIQIGGMGVLTFTSFFALYFSGNTSIYSQMMVKDMLDSRTFNELGPTLLYIFTFTIVVELAGAAVVWWSIHDVLTNLSVHQQIKFSLFHSLSSFCNAGFSTLPGGMSNPALMNSNQSIYLVTSVIVLAGAIGFPVLVNVRNALAEYMKRLVDRIRHRDRAGRSIHLYNLNTKLSFNAMLLIFLISAVAFLLLEHNNTMKGMSLYTQVCQSIFNATCPRSSGFQSLSPELFSPSTLLMIVLLMWIGGASQSTAGGVKVNTIATSLLNLRATVLGKDRVVAFNRTISSTSIRRANAVIALSIVSLFTFSMILLQLEPELPVKSVVFETVSALFTVGSSLGITDQLGEPAKIVLSAAMFLGRVGIISMLIGLTGNRTTSPVTFPTDNIIIN